jgi:predicted MFS family arabinose efflux permease
MTVVGASTFNVLPLLTAGAANTLGFSERQVGILSLMICVGSGASSLLAGLWVRSVHWPRTAAVALGGMLVTISLTMMMHRYWAFVLMQGAAGFFAGAIFCLALTILSDREDSARSFGVSTAMQVTYQVAALLAGPVLLRSGGLNSVLLLLAIPAGLAMLLTPLLPTHGRTVLHSQVRRGLLAPATVIALIGYGVFFVNAGAFWTYVELIGQARGMTPRVVANSVAASVSAGVLGGLLAWALGNRLGRLWPLMIATTLTVAAALLLIASSTTAAFVVSGMLYFFAWNYSYAYQLDVVNAVDVTGRGVAVTQVFGFLGVAAGAGVAAYFVRPGDYSAVTWLVIVAVCLSTALFSLSSAVSKYANARHTLAEECG